MRLLDLREQQRVLLLAVHVGLGDQLRRVDVGFDLVALRSGQRGLNAVVAIRTDPARQAVDRPSLSRPMVLSSESKPIILIVSAFLFSATGLARAFAMIRFEANTPRRFGLAVIKSVMMFSRSWPGRRRPCRRPA